VHEDDPLLGIVHLNLGELFKKRSQINGLFPLSGGVGFGRMRLSMVWRSVQLQAPPEALGWEIGTLEVKPEIKAINLPDGLGNLRLKLSTSLGSGKMYSSKQHNGWSSYRHRSHWLAVQKRYSSCMSIRFRDKKLIGGNNAAFAVLWLRDIPDEEEREIELTVWKGDFKRAIACSLEEPGEKIGSIKLTLRFWSGLGQAHSKWANKDPDLKNVVEVLETARDNLDEQEAGEKAGVIQDESDTESHGGSDDNDSSTDDDSDSERRRNTKRDTRESNDSSQGLADQYREKRQEKKGEHRRHRGVMQFRLPRTARWAMHKGERVQDKVAGIFKHHTREPGVETEV
jgi:hypothetical protein